MANDLPSRMTAARRAKGLTQQQIANTLGVSRAAVGQWEAGNTEPSVRNYKALMDLLDIADKLEIPGALGDDLRNMTWRHISARGLDVENNIDLPITMVAITENAECVPIKTYANAVFDYLPRPEVLRQDKEAYGLMVATEAMAPRFENEDILYVSAKEYPANGEYAVVLISDDGHEFFVLRRLLYTLKTDIILELFNPASTWTYPKSAVKAVHRVVPWNELLNPRTDRDRLLQQRP